MADSERLEVMIRMRREGKALQEIGNNFGVSREYVRQLLKGTDVEGLRVARGNKVNVERCQKIEQLWNEGYFVKEIADRMGSSEGAVAQLIWRMRKRGWNLPYRRVDLVYPNTYQNR